MGVELVFPSFLLYVDITDMLPVHPMEAEGEKHPSTSLIK